jgi:hypothetical protein
MWNLSQLDQSLGNPAKAKRKLGGAAASVSASSLRK